MNPLSRKRQTAVDRSIDASDERRTYGTWLLSEHRRHAGLLRASKWVAIARWPSPCPYEIQGAIGEGERGRASPPPLRARSSELRGHLESPPPPPAVPAAAARSAAARGSRRGRARRRRPRFPPRPRVPPPPQAMPPRSATVRLGSSRIGVSLGGDSARSLAVASLLSLGREDGDDYDALLSPARRRRARDRRPRLAAYRRQAAPARGPGRGGHARPRAALVPPRPGAHGRPHVGRFLASGFGGFTPSGFGPPSGCTPSDAVARRAPAPASEAGAFSARTASAGHRAALLTPARPPRRSPR
jgi:hypothetical protein